MINRAFIDEFTQRGLQIPEVVFDTVSTNSQETVETMVMGTEPLKVLEETRKVMGEENPHILYGIDLMESVFGLNKLAAGNAILHFYKGWRSQIEIDYWNRKL